MKVTGAVSQNEEHMNASIPANVNRMNISISGSDVVIARIHARVLDIHNFQHFKSTVLPLFKPRAKILIDLGEVTFMDSLGLGALLSCFGQAYLTGGKDKLCAPTPPVQRAFDATVITRIFEIFPNQFDAVNSYSNQPS